jgi:phosphate transport system substrate-binding protein
MKCTFRSAIAALLALSVVACNQRQAPENGASAPAATTGTNPPLAGTITLDGSSTIFPVSTVMAEAFQRQHPGVRVTVRESGTGGGFRKFCAGEIDIAGASRPMNAAEIERCAASRIELVELPVAFDSLVVVVNPANTFVSCLTLPELKKIWEPAADHRVTRWNQVRASFPDKPLALLGPGTASGTFDYFTLAVVGTESSSRKDYRSSEDDNVLVEGVVSSPDALAYFGYAYYAANRDKLKLVSIDDGDGCVAPSAETVVDNAYRPLARPLFIYASRKAMARPEAKAFAEFYVSPDNAPHVERVGYVPLPPATLLSVGRRLDQNVTGSILGGRGSVLGVTAETFQDDDKLKSALVR